MSYDIIQKILEFLPLTATGTKFDISTITTVLSNYYDYLEERYNHFKCIKPKDHMGENVAELCTVILVDDERLESEGDFRPRTLDISLTHLRIFLILDSIYGKLRNIRRLKSFSET